MNNRRKSRRSGARRDRGRGGLSQPPWKPIYYRRPPYSILSEDQVEDIHRTGHKILMEVGITVLCPDARRSYREAGFDVDEESQRVQFDPDGVEELIAQAPSAFTLHARNPDKNIRIGDGYAAFTSVGGPAYVMDLDNGRRNGTHEEMCDWLRLTQSLDIIHQEGGGGFEAMDLPADTRHLDRNYAEAKLLDKTWVPWTIGRTQTIDAIEMGAIMMGKKPEELAEAPIYSAIINTNSPLQLDIPMAEGLMIMAGYGQAVIVTPFTLAGAMSPVTLAGTLAQQHAEAMAGIALAQIVRPGAPVMYGGFSSNVDMKTGSPAFGTPEYTQAAQASGQLSRRLGVPYRSSNVTAANAPDAQAAYESCMSIWGAMTGHANMIKHAAGWLHGGLTASLEKLIIDAEILQMMSAWTEPLQVDESTLALDAVSEVGPGGHYFGAAHTMERYESAFYAPLLSNWDNYETWLDRGGITAEQRANQIWKQLLRNYEQPALDPAIDEALKEYVTRRKREIG